MTGPKKGSFPSECVCTKAPLDALCIVEVLANFANHPKILCQCTRFSVRLRVTHLLLADRYPFDYNDVIQCSDKQLYHDNMIHHDNMMDTGMTT